MDIEAGGVSDHVAGGIGGVQAVLGEDPGVSGAELDHQFLFIVMGHERDIHGQSFSFLYLIRSRGTLPPRMRFAIFR